MIKVYTDGGARGNPGPAAIGVYITNGEDRELFSLGKTIGITTNNVAEYRAVIEALDWLVDHKALVKNQDVAFLMDSELVCRQVNGIYRVKNIALQELLLQVRQKERTTGSRIRYSHIPRKQNKKADALLNKALDKT